VGPLKQGIFLKFYNYEGKHKEFYKFFLFSMKYIFPFQVKPKFGTQILPPAVDKFMGFRAHQLISIFKKHKASFRLGKLYKS